MPGHAPTCAQLYVARVEADEEAEPRLVPVMRMRV